MPTSSNYVCRPCGAFMKIEQNGVTVEEQTEDGQPYKLWDADMYRCPSCGHEVISGFGRGPLAEHYQPDYQRKRERLAPIIEVK
jgi:DNA-directed RNA polymerase subunit RPC12/RpoP